MPRECARATCAHYMRRLLCCADGAEDMLELRYARVDDVTPLIDAYGCYFECC